MLKVGMTFASIFLLAGEPLNFKKTLQRQGKGKTMSKNTKGNQNTTKATTEVIGMGKGMSAKDTQALLARLQEMEHKLAEAEAAKAALEAKVKTSSKREPKAPDSYNVLQPVFVALRNNIGKNIVDDSVLVDIFKNAAATLGITIDNAIAVRLVDKTVQHNSISNIAKADTLSSAEGRKEAYLEMLSQAETMLDQLEPADIGRMRSDYNAAYAAKVAKLK